MAFFPRPIEDWITIMAATALHATTEILTDPFRLAASISGSHCGAAIAEVECAVTIATGICKLDCFIYSCPDGVLANKSDEAIGDGTLSYAFTTAGTGVYRKTFPVSWEDQGPKEGIGSGGIIGLIQNPGSSGTGTATVRIRRYRWEESG